MKWVLCTHFFTLNLCIIIVNSYLVDDFCFCPLPTLPLLLPDSLSHQTPSPLPLSLSSPLSTQSHVFQTGLELLTLCLLLSARFTRVQHCCWILWCWGLNPGLSECQASTLHTELLPQCIGSYSYICVLPLPNDAYPSYPIDSLNSHQGS